MMTKELTGDILEDQIYRIAATLLNTELLEKMFLWPFFTLVQNINEPRIFDIHQNGVDEELAFGPPTGKVWEILSCVCTYACDANVADRTVRVRIKRRSTDAIIKRGYNETRAATESFEGEIGTPAPSANAFPVDRWDTRITLTDDNYLSFIASENGQAGDTLTIKAVVKETINYAP